jgi:peptidoglycan hydrolase-like protein with peptidoglycan-binding domain
MATYEHNSAQFGYLDLDDLSGVQKALAKLGFDPGKIDGIDGPNTQKAVRAFQAHALIDVDGKVGKNTRQALVTELAAKSGAAKPATT